MTNEIIPLIPVPKLTDARMKELYDALMKQPNKPIPQVDPKEDTLEDKLKKKEAIERKYERKSSRSLKLCLAGIFVASGFLMASTFASQPITSYKISFYGGGLAFGLVTAIGSGVYASIKDREKIRELETLGF
ncbi:hypothetical protein HYX19_00770 [Candidatus Woesearchaeota archaeon]|nr:hypothetical protein [Candidatus Woesearchaeota archaeon]